MKTLGACVCMFVCVCMYVTRVRGAFGEPQVLDSLVTTFHQLISIFFTCFCVLCIKLLFPSGAPVVRATSTTDGSSDGEEYGHRAVVSASAARAPSKDREGFVARVRKAPLAKLPDAPHAF